MSLEPLCAEDSFVAYLNRKTNIAMIALVISVLIQLGTISSSADFYSLSESQQTHYIINTDLGDM